MKIAAIVLGSALATVSILTTVAAAAEQTWVGEISDSACALQHESGTENVPAPPANECVANCVRGGSKYVFVTDGKVLQIANQNATGLAELAGAQVKLTGEAKGSTVTVSKIEKAP